MKYKLLIPAFMSLLLMLTEYIFAQTPTDEELEALERQIEQQEAEQVESKRRSEAEAKRKAEEEAKKIELEKQRAAEEEQHKVAEEEAARVKAEAEKKEKYSLLIKEAEQAVINKDKELAISKFNEALKFYPGDAVAISGIQAAEKLPEKVCLDFPGEWHWERIGTMTAEPDGTVKGLAVFIPWSGTWTCDGKTRLIEVKSTFGDFSGVLKEDGCLTGSDGYGSGCWRKKGTTDPSKKEQKETETFNPFKR